MFMETHALHARFIVFGTYLKGQGLGWVKRRHQLGDVAGDPLRAWQAAGGMHRHDLHTKASSGRRCQSVPRHVALATKFGLVTATFLALRAS